MSPASILRRQQDPLKWLLEYWLDIAVIGIIRGEDMKLMVLRVDMEVDKMSDREF